jgi:GMP synthase (glutamine-hydrolysing)
MKIALIELGSIHLNELIDLLNKYDLNIFNGLNVSIKDVEEYNLVIISGGHNVTPVAEIHDDYLKNLKEIIRNSDKPIIGICYGLQLIAATFGASLKKLIHKKKGILEINLINEHEIFKGIKSFTVYEGHEYAVAEMSKELVAYAKSKDGIEIIKHKYKEIWGMQFHPEVFTDKTLGDEIFKNLLEYIATKQDNILYS